MTATYTEEERRVFEYYNGEKKVFCDPLAIYRKLLVATHGKPNTLANAARVKLAPPDESIAKINPQFYLQAEAEYAAKLVEASNAADLLEELVRKLFGLKEIDPNTGAGADSYLCMKIWDDFARFMAKKKPTAATEPTSSIPTDGQPDIVPITESGSGLS